MLCSNLCSAKHAASSNHKLLYVSNENALETQLLRYPGDDWNGCKREYCPNDVNDCSKLRRLNYAGAWGFLFSS
jgi:hypothetical protein